ncbi:DUF418 domain-containing protein [Streptomyces sp. AP-93]|uniref:DUF418 domain-containing protein n=1 Tax=Streptomyces sp. AP-93 TaxID=2929048 RepID=UPI001FAFC964|nr:DUF418 domain-containing protein [Streptomyces sp. AP-93]MCJ0868711.1 DUF418 domain-containing protein [Streptomyces sp. AP-93]
MSATAAAHARTDRLARIPEVDALRGFALLGILLVNALMMAGPYGPGGAVDPGASALDRTVEGIIQTFAVGKFYLMFSFLFGYSFTLQQDSAAREGASAVPRMLRRSLGLLVLGLLHAVLLYTGDILMTYALLGLILIAARTCSPGTALRAARIVYGCTSAFLLLLGLGSLFMSDAEAAGLNELPAEFAALVADYRGDPASVVRANLGQLPDALLAVPLMGGFVLTAFLAGLYCGKRRLLADTGRHAARMRRICVLGVAVGLPGSLFMALAAGGALGPRWFLFGSVVGMVTAPALTAAYVCGMLLFMKTAPGGRVALLLAPAGRMALTNYLSQSLVMALVFTAYGLALYDRLGAAVVALGALALYGAQLALSKHLMARHRYGPVEWLLRVVTLARLPRSRDERRNPVAS